MCEHSLLVPHPLSLSVLCNEGQLLGRDLILFDDNAYLRGHITGSDCSKGVIQLSLDTVYPLRVYGGVLEPHDTPIDMPHALLSPGTTATLHADGSLHFFLSVSGDGWIVPRDAPVPEDVS